MSLFHGQEKEGKLSCRETLFPSALSPRLIGCHKALMNGFLRTMRVSNRLLLDVLKGQVGDRMPIWMMRQAGRYLPEYRATRAEAGSFWISATIRSLLVR
jgi:hypothetical protein